MGVPTEQLIVVTSGGNRVDIDALVEELRSQSTRVLADDEIGIVIYVGDLGLYSLKAVASGGFVSSALTELSRPRFAPKLVRHQIGATVFSMTADTVFVVQEGETIRKVRAEKLQKGMRLATGEKVYS